MVRVCVERSLIKKLVILFKPGAQISGDQRGKFHEAMARFEERNLASGRCLWRPLCRLPSFLNGTPVLLAQSGSNFYMLKACSLERTSTTHVLQCLCRRHTYQIHVLDFVFTTKTPFNACPWSLHIVRTMCLWHYCIISSHTSKEHEVSNMKLVPTLYSKLDWGLTWTLRISSNRIVRFHQI